jgi:hypothetical protein
MGPTRDLGPATVTWGATVISEIFEEVRLTLTGADPGEVKEAIYGNTPVDHIMMGYSACSLTVPATRIALATLATLLPGGTNSGGASGYVGVLPGDTVGVSMYDNGLPLFVKPIVAGVAASNGNWMRLERTYPVANFDVVFNLGDQRVYGLTFHAHPDETSKLLWSAGTVATGASYA